MAIFVGLWPPTFFLLGEVLQDLEASPAQQALRAHRPTFGGKARSPEESMAELVADSAFRRPRRPVGR
jgi:hypothetical protein